MKRAYTVFFSVAVAALLVSLAGCFTEREALGKDRAILKGGQQVSGDMVGWVAVPNTAPEMRQEKNRNISYAVLSTHNVIPENLSGWVAMNPSFFAKMTDIKVDTPPATATERWVLKPEGKSVPKDKNGWIALPFSEPQIESSAHKKDREMAALAGGNIIPKEMHGWVALDRETLAKVTAEFMNKGSGSELPKTK
ncbi:MAG: hypothetical protein NTW87_12865 [Planctomycetota bacterium]|nr:hypothetical protein [Planctomycetota bacterium]